MEETYPVLADGEIIGMLHVKEEGSATVFTARCRMREGIVRLSVYGETGEGYLGVLAPENGEMCLSRRLSRAAMRAFPKEIVEAGIAGRGRASIPVLPETETETETPPEPETEREPPSETSPEPPEPEEDERLWYASTDGALVCFDGEKNLVALPVGDSRIPEGAAGRTITMEDREYLVFPAPHGHIRF